MARGTRFASGPAHEAAALLSRGKFLIQTISPAELAARDIVEPGLRERSVARHDRSGRLADEPKPIIYAELDDIDALVDVRTAKPSG
jgi:hypothetical protein